jgi:hypothetical protein
MVSLTSMLVMYTLYQSVAGSLPQTAYLKMIDIWLLFGLIMPFVVFLCQVVSKLMEVHFISFHNIKNTPCTNPHTYRNFQWVPKHSVK